MSLSSTQTLSRSRESQAILDESRDIDEGATDELGAEVGIQPHQLGVRPSGNALTADEDLRSHAGLFSRIPDDLIISLLEWLDENALLSLGSTCRALYAYTTFDQLWREIAISSGVQVTWRGSWRASLLKLPSKRLAGVDCRNLFSDALHRPYVCSQIPLGLYFENIPVSNQIMRLEDLDPEEFAASWTDKPFILTQPVKKWPIYQTWSEEILLEKFGRTSFRAEAVDWPLQTYVDYMLSNNDESPLYLFDRSFVEKMGLKIGADGGYWPPPCFGEDYFDLLGGQRPDSKWLIVGPARSGSTFHKDPNATSAWNAVIRGSKYWIMFPRSVLPPGVHLSQDESEVTSPLSIAEWFLTFFDDARNTPGCIEGICGPGEVVHVPSEWFHLVVNIEPAIAVTQNFVPRSHLKSAIKFLKHKASQVSGFTSDIKDPYALFMERLEAHHPDIVEGLQDTVSKKRKWEEVVQHGSVEQPEKGGAFGFGFGSDIEEEIP
jgi:hypothetical protein